MRLEADSKTSKAFEYSANARSQDLCAKSPSAIYRVARLEDPSCELSLKDELRLPVPHRVSA